MNTTASDDTASSNDKPGNDQPGNDQPGNDPFSKDTASNDTASSPRSGIPTGSQPPYRPALCRPVDDRMLAGVAAGVARYLGADVTLVRVILAVLVFVGGAGVPLYLAGWLLIPEEGAEQSIAGDLLGSLENRRR